MVWRKGRRWSIYIAGGWEEGGRGVESRRDLTAESESRPERGEKERGWDQMGLRGTWVLFVGGNVYNFYFLVVYIHTCGVESTYYRGNGFVRVGMG